MSNNWRTTEQIIFDNKVLRLMLEARKLGCTAKIPVAGIDNDEINAEEKALLAIQSALVSAAEVQNRGAAVAAKYVPSTTLTPMQRVTTARGAKEFNLKSEIARLTAMLPGTKGTTKACLESKIAKLSGDLAGLPPEATAAPKLTAAQEKLAVQFVALQRVVQNNKSESATAKAAASQIEKLSAELKALGVDPANTNLDLAYSDCMRRNSCSPSSNQSHDDNDHE